MTEPETPPPFKPLTISGLFIGSLMTGAMICGAIGALALFFFADGIFDVGPDPALPAAEVTQVRQQVARVDARIAELEKTAQTQREAVPDLPNADHLDDLQKSLEENTEQTKVLEEKVDALSTDTRTESRAAQIALGLTQIKTAFDSDLPITAGIDKLKQSVSEESLRKTLDDLTTATQSNFPTKKELLTDIETMKASLNQPPVDPANLTWKERAAFEMNKFVKVQPKQLTVERSALEKAESAIRNNDFAAAMTAIKQIPASAEQQIFYKKMETRIAAEMMIHNIILGVTQKANAGNGGTLY